MNNKYNVGDKVVLIQNNGDSCTTVKLIISKVDPLPNYTVYDFKDHYYCRTEENLYSPSEAIEFITNYINKTEE